MEKGLPAVPALNNSHRPFPFILPYCFFFMSETLSTHGEFQSFLCGLEFRIHICTSLGNVGKCDTYRITSVIVECAGGVGRSLGCEINNLSIDRIAAVEVNRYVVCVRLSSRSPGCQSALGNDVIIKLCAACKGRIQEINSQVLVFAQLEEIAQEEPPLLE